MPVRLHKQGEKQFFQYGTHGKKYFFTTEVGKKRAIEKAKKQETAIHLSQLREQGRIPPYSGGKSIQAPWVLNGVYRPPTLLL